MTSFASIEFAPLMPWPFLAVVALLGALLIGYGLARRAPGMGWRLLALSAGLLALANPSVVEEQRAGLTDVGLIVVDESLSQDIGERRERGEQAIARLQAKFEHEKNLELRVLRAGRASSGADQLPDGTRLFAQIAQALNDVPRGRRAGVAIVTDGQVHDVPESLERADPGAPVHVLLTGERDERDRRLVVVRAPSYAIVDEPSAITVRVEDDGASGFVRLRLSQDGAAAREVTVRIGEDNEIPFTVNHAGSTVLDIEVSGSSDELTLVNNRAVVLVNGVRERLRVLLVSGEPHAGERTWRNILKSDPSVDLVHFTILRPPQKQDGTPIRELSLISFPTRELFQIKLHEFDLVIFDRYRRRGVLPDAYLANVVEYVQNGGAVLTAAGPAFATPLSLHRTPLAHVLPSQPTGAVLTAGYRPQLTDLGRRHPVTADLPGAGLAGENPSWGRWFRLIDVESPRGTTLMSGLSNKPLLILDRVGQGRVAQLLSDHAWLWARGYESGGPQSELLRRIAHWLMQEPDLEEEDLRARSDGNRLSIIRRSLTPHTGTVSVTAPSGAVTQVRLRDDGHGQESGSMVVDEPGLYRMSDGERTTLIAVGDVNPLEYADMRTSPDRLAPLAEATGGGVFWLSDGMPDARRSKPERRAAGHNWLALRANGDYVVSGVQQVPLMPALLALVLFLGLTMLSWYREGR